MRVLQRGRWLAVALVLAAAGGGGAGCAYYNGFYNAKRAFSDAEDLGKDVDLQNQPTSQQRSLYQTAIRKSENLLDEYPESSLVDDALFLIGKSQFRMKSYRECVRYMDNLLINFPHSQFAEEARYLKSLSHLALREEQVALDQFRLLRESFPDGQFGVRALYRLGDTYREAERYDEAVQYYQTYLENYPDDEARVEVALSLADVYTQREEFEKAVEVLEDIDRKHATNEQRFMADLARARALNRLGRNEEAAQLLDSIVGDAQYFKRRAVVLMLQGEVELDLGEEERGKEILEGVAAEFMGKNPQTQARLKLARYYLRQYGPDDSRLRDQMEVGMGERPTGDSAREFGDLNQKITEYEQLREKFAEGDSLAYQQAFRLGELLLTDLQQPARAVEFYHDVLELAPTSALAPRAAYAIGYIQQARADSAAADSTFAMLREDYPQSPQARSLEGEVFLEAKPKDLATLQAEANDSSEPSAGNRGVPISTEESDRRVLTRGGPGACYPRSR
jgi:TolA-binding protein